MATTTKTFTFDSTLESWVGNPATGDVAMSRDTGDGSPGTGCLSARITGKNKNPGESYWEWTGTWEDLGVPAGATVTEVGTSPDNDYNWRCSEYTSGTGTNATGPFALGPRIAPGSGGNLAHGDPRGFRVSRQLWHRLQSSRCVVWERLATAPDDRFLQRPSNQHPVQHCLPKDSKTSCGR